MKRFLFLLVFLLSCSSFAQTYVEKYNSLNGRYEYFDKQTNKMVAYKSYNSLNGTWETTYVNNNQQGNGRYIPQKQRTDDNFALLQQVMAEKQAKYDANYQKIQEHMKSIAENMLLTIDDRKTFISVSENFDKKCVNSLKGKNYDLSSNSKTNEIINYLTNCYNQVVSEVKSNTNSNANLTSQSKSLNSSDSPLISGGYKTNQILEYQYNSKTKEYDLIFNEEISSELFFTAKRIDFKRGTNDWKGSEWSYQGFDDKKNHVFYDDYKQTITFDKNFNTITWYSNPKGTIFQKIFVYRYLTKDDSVKPDIIYTTN